MTQIYHEPLPAALMYDKNEAELAPKNNKGKKCLGGMLILKVITQAILQRTNPTGKWHPDSLG